MWIYNIKVTNDDFLWRYKQMNNENQQEQSTEESQKTGNFWQDKALPFLKDIWDDKIKCWYMLILFLQVFFLLLQFIPIMKIATEVKIALFGDMRVEVENFSMFGFIEKIAEEMSGFEVFYVIATIAFFLASFVKTIPYFVRKRDNIGRGFLGVQIGLILYMLFFLIFVMSGKEMATSMERNGIELEKNEIFSLTFGGHLYWIVAVALFAAEWVLTIRIKEEKINEEVETRVNARVAEILRKQKIEESLNVIKNKQIIEDLYKDEELQKQNQQEVTQ